MDDLDLPDDLEDVEVIYSDDEGAYEENLENMLDDVDIADNDDGIELEIVDTSILTFGKHQKSVFSSDLNKEENLAATGGEDDIAFLWNSENGEVILECTGHKDSVSEVCFNHDSQYLATGDMAGMIQVWSTSQNKLIWCFEGDDMEWLMWHPMANVLFCGCHSGDVYIWQIPQGNCKVLPSPNNETATCAKIIPNGKQILVGYQDGKLQLWNIKEANVVWTCSDFQTITGLDINKEGTLALVAPGAGVLKLSDGKTIATLLPEGEIEIEAGLFDSDLGVIATGSLSGQLCVWEIGRYALRHQARIECAVTVLKWGSDGKIFIGAADGAIYVCDVKSGSLIETVTGHKSDIFSISVFRNDKKILTTSDDGTAKIFKVK